MASSPLIDLNGASSMLTMLRGNSPPTLDGLCDDVILLILDALDELDISSLSLSLTNHRLRSLVAPRLFKTLYVNRPIRSLQYSDFVHGRAKRLKIDMFGSKWWWCSGEYCNGSDAADIFRLVDRLENVTSLEVSMMSRSADLFQSALKNNQGSLFYLRRIKHLQVTPPAAFLLHHCPDLEKLKVRGADCGQDRYYNLAQIMAPLQSWEPRDMFQLVHIDANALWSPAELRFLIQTYPHLQHLDMASDTYCYRTSIVNIIELLSAGMTSLVSLKLSHMNYLNQSAGIGTPFGMNRIIKGKEDRLALWRECEAKQVEVENEVMRMAFGMIPTLRVCWAGERRKAYLLDNEFKILGNGSRDPASLKWMWERNPEVVDADGALSYKYKMERSEIVVRHEIGS